MSEAVEIDLPIDVGSGRAGCPECGKVFKAGPGLARHRSITHGVGIGEMVQCPQCDRMLSPVSLQKHIRTLHGVKTKRGRPVGSKNHPKPSVPRVPKAVTAEQITRTTAAMIWPEGVPHGMLEPLLRWNTQTEAFLAKAQGQ